MERTRAKLSQMTLLITAVLLICLAIPGMAYAAAGSSTLQSGTLAQASGETGLNAQASTSKVTLYAKSSTSSTKTLKASGLNASKAKWTSSNKSVATVKAGKVTAKKAGKTNVTAVVGKKTFTFKVTVKNVTLNKKSLALAKGETAVKALKLTGDTAKSVKSSDSKVVKVIKTSNGATLKGLYAGEATVIITSNGGQSFKCKVTVNAGSTVSPDKAITGITKNSVILDYNINKYPDGYFIHLKVKDSSIAYDKWSKSLKVELVEGATCKLERDADGDWEYDGHKVTAGKLTVTSGKSSITYTVEAFEASSGMFEHT